MDKNEHTLFDYIAEGLVNLAMGAPSEELLKKCTDALKTATVHRMDDPDAYNLFQYGPEMGDVKYRNAVAKMLTEEYKAPVDGNDLIVTAGATQGVHIISHLLFSPGDLVFVENPTYFIATKIFEYDAGLKLKGVPMDDYGIIPDELEKILEANKNYRPRELTDRKPYWGILYALSVFQNPRGMCLPPDRCRRVIELARKYNLLILSDDVYNLLYHDEPPPRLFSYDKKEDPDYSGNAISNASFSKIFGPGMRLGWMEAPDKVKKIICGSGLSQSGGSFNHTISGIMTSLIDLGIMKKMLTEARPIYKERCETMCNTLRKEIPEVEFIMPKGGYFLWLKLPNGINGKELLKVCNKDYKLNFCPGIATSVSGDFQDCIRLAFCHYDCKKLVEASTTLAQAIKYMLQNKT